MAKDKKVQWHPAFYGAMHLELKENKEELEFTEELILNTMPLRVDMQIQIAKNLLSVLSDEDIAEKTELAIEIIKGLRREVVQ